MCCLFGTVVDVDVDVNVIASFLAAPHSLMIWKLRAFHLLIMAWECNYQNEQFFSLSAISLLFLLGKRRGARTHTHKQKRQCDMFHPFKTNERNEIKHILLMAFTWKKAFNRLTFSSLVHMNFKATTAPTITANNRAERECIKCWKADNKFFLHIG